MIAQRILRSARPALRSATVAGSVPRSVAARRTYASGPTEGFKPGSDTPWIVASVLGFGGLFFYVTSPGSKKGGHGHGHGHDDGHASEKEESHDEPEEAPEPPKEPKELPDGSIEHPEGFIEVKRPEIRDDAPEGDKFLHERKIPDEHAVEKQSQSKKERSLPVDDTTFKHGVAAAKDGNHISDPKKVVESAKAAKEEKYAAKDN